MWGGGGEGEEIDVGGGYRKRDCLQNLVNRSPGWLLCGPAPLEIQTRQFFSVESKKNV